MEKVREYYCPYCGKSFSDQNWSIDHIIPRQMGGPKKFKIISCYSCNNKLSKLVEQPAIQTPDIMNLIASNRQDGHIIQTRRSRNIIPLHRGVGLSFGQPVKLYYDLNQQTKELCFLKPFPESFDYERLFSQHGQAIIPISLGADKDEIALASLASKIVLGTSYWIWGEKFAGSEYGRQLRLLLCRKDTEDILKMQANDHHAILTPDITKLYGELNGKEIDAFDNSPHHTIVFNRLSDSLFSLVNLFGKYESMIYIGEFDQSVVDIDDEDGIIVIASTIDNVVIMMDFKQYETWKLNQLNSQYKESET